MPFTDPLKHVAVPDEFREGARNAVRVCLDVRPEEKVTVITDLASAQIGASFVRELEQTNRRVSVFVLEDFGPRPHTAMPPAILDDLSSSDVSIYAVWGQPGELVTRMEMTRVVNAHKIRHAHMINVSPRIMTEGMRADFRRVDAISSQLWSLVRNVRHIHATTPLGTDIVVDLRPDYHWRKTSGIIDRDTWGNLPGGEIFTAPAAVNGTFVGDGVVGDYLCAKYGDLAATPLTLEIRDSRLIRAACANTALEREFWEYCHKDENSDRVGEFAIGTNVALTHVIGQILQDEKIPGVHIAFGNPDPEHTGADWTSSTHIDVVGTRFTIQLDDQTIMREGSFTLS